MCFTAGPFSFYFFLLVWHNFCIFADENNFALLYGMRIIKQKNCIIYYD